MHTTYSPSSSIIWNLTERTLASRVYVSWQLSFIALKHFDLTHTLLVHARVVSHSAAVPVLCWAARFVWNLELGAKFPLGAAPTLQVPTPYPQRVRPRQAKEKQPGPPPVIPPHSPAQLSGIQRSRTGPSEARRD